MLPNQIKLLNRTTLRDLVFVSNKVNLKGNVTTLLNITLTFLEQANRLDLYYKTRALAQELNITITEVFKLSNQSKDDLFNSKADVLDKIRKTFYVNTHLNKLREYKETLEDYNANIPIVINDSNITMNFDALSLDDVKRLNENSLKQMLVNQNRRVFTENIAIRNISAFFDIKLDQLKNMSVPEVLTEILGISLADFASLHQLTLAQLNMTKRVKISSVSNSFDQSLYSITKAIIKSKGKLFLHNSNIGCLICILKYCVRFISRTFLNFFQFIPS